MTDRPDGFNPFPPRGVNPRRREKRNRPVSGRTSTSQKDLPKPVVLPPINTASLTSVETIERNQPSPDTRPQTADACTLLKANGRGNGDRDVAVLDENPADQIIIQDDVGQRGEALQKTVAMHQNYLAQLAADRKREKDHLDFALQEISKMNDYIESVSKELIHSNSKNVNLKEQVELWRREEYNRKMQYLVSQAENLLLEEAHEKLLAESRTQAVTQQKRYIELQKMFTKTQEEQLSNDTPGSARSPEDSRTKSLSIPIPETVDRDHGLSMEEITLPNSPTRNPENPANIDSMTDLVNHAPEFRLELKKDRSVDASRARSANGDNQSLINPLTYRVANPMNETKLNPVDDSYTFPSSPTVCPRNKHKLKSCTVNKSRISSRSISASPSSRVGKMEGEYISTGGNGQRSKSERSNRSTRGAAIEFQNAMRCLAESRPEIWTKGSENGKELKPISIPVPSRNNTSMSPECYPESPVISAEKSTDCHLLYPAEKRSAIHSIPVSHINSSDRDVFSEENSSDSPLKSEMYSECPIVQEDIRTCSQVISPDNRSKILRIPEDNSSDSHIVQGDKDSGNPATSQENRSKSHLIPEDNHSDSSTVQEDRRSCSLVISPENVSKIHLIPDDNCSNSSIVQEDRRSGSPGTSHETRSESHLIPEDNRPDSPFVQEDNRSGNPVIYPETRSESHLMPEDNPSDSHIVQEDNRSCSPVISPENRSKILLIPKDNRSDSPIVQGDRRSGNPGTSPDNCSIIHLIPEDNCSDSLIVQGDRRSGNPGTSSDNCSIIPLIPEVNCSDSPIVQEDGRSDSSVIYPANRSESHLMPEDNPSDSAIVQEDSRSNSSVIY